jgi:hypothetical protein
MRDIAGGDSEEDSRKAFLSAGAEVPSAGQPSAAVPT